MKKHFRTVLSLVLALAIVLLAMPATVAEDEEWATPCTLAPYFREYKDDTMWITINQVVMDDLSYTVADVQLRDISRFLVGLAGDKPNGGHEALSAMSQRLGAILAVNGDQYGDHKYGIIIRNGELIRVHDTTRNMLIVDKNGDMTVDADRKHDDFEAIAQQLMAENVIHTFEFGPELVRDGHTVEFSKEFDVISTRDTRLEPRTGIGQIGPMHYVIIVVDGRGDSKGISLQNFAQMFVDYGAQVAMNLDGGGSAEMTFMGEIISNISGSKERTLSDIIYFR